MKTKRILTGLLTALVLMFSAVIAWSLTSSGEYAYAGVILVGILGGFSGKVGPVVGGKWKSISYMRAYVIPANPDSPGQQTQRSKFSNAVFMSRQLISTVLRPYWDPFLSTMSGYNRWIQLNLPFLSEGVPAATLDLIMSKGTLTGVQGFSAAMDPASGIIAFTWTNNTGQGNALSTDQMHVVVLGINGQLLSSQLLATTRVTGNGEIDIPTGEDPTNFNAYAFFIQGSGSSLSVSDSVSATVGEI